jgi:hypothetical protein
MMISKAMGVLGKASRTVFTAKTVAYVGNRFNWYYKLLLDYDFSKTMLKMHDVNRMERQMNDGQRNYNYTSKKVFHVTPEGYIYDIHTGAVFGNVDDPKFNKYNQQDEGYDPTVNEGKIA